MIGHRTQMSKRSNKKVYNPKTSEKKSKAFLNPNYLIQSDDITSDSNEIEVHREESLLYQRDEVREIPSSQLLKVFHEIL
jgi:hypothetical protein